MKDCVTTVARDKAQAERIVARLLEIGFWDADVTVRYSHRTDVTESVDAQKSRATVGTVLGGVLGMIVGGTVFLLASLGVVDLPGLRIFLSAGPVLSALAGATAGAGFCAPAGGIVGLAFVRSAARREVPRQRPSVSVHVRSEDEHAQAEIVFREFGLPATPQPWARPEPSHAH